jgi:colicin import membrane protein
MGAIATLGSILPILGGITTAVTTIDRTMQMIGDFGEDSQRRQQEQALRHLQENQRLEYEHLTQKNAQGRAEIALNAELAEKERRESLRRAVSRKRAEFGSSGIGSASGSAEAVLLGMFEESKEERETREQLDTMRSRALDLNESQKKSLNLLQATQLAQKQRLERLY